MMLSKHQAEKLLELFRDYVQDEKEVSELRAQGRWSKARGVEDSAERSHQEMVDYLDSLTIGRVVVGDDQLGRVITQVLEDHHGKEGQG